jgi:hypothetical protein
MERMASPMLVNLPDNEDYKSTGENGMAFFFIIPPIKDFKNRRQICCAGDLLYPLQDVQIYPNEDRVFPRIRNRSQNWEENLREIDGGLLIGSTKLSLFSEHYGEYFHATYKDLTNEGKSLYNTLKKLYGDIIIVTLLDT